MKGEDCAEYRVCLRWFNLDAGICMPSRASDISRSSLVCDVTSGLVGGW